MDILQNQSFLTILGIIITVIIALIIYRLQKQKKSVGFRILSNTSLLSVQEEIKKDIEILYKGKPVKQVQLIILKVVSLGNIPIRCDDYETPIAINLGEKSQILSVEILRKEPDDLKVSIGVEENKIVLQKCLLNQEDMVTIRILATNVKQEIKVEGRIAGVKKINQISEDPRLLRILSWISIISMFGALVLGIIGQMLGIYPPGLPAPSGILISIGIVLIVIVMFWDRRNKKRIKKEIELLTSKKSDSPKMYSLKDW